MKIPTTHSKAILKDQSGFILATVVVMTLILSVVILSFMSLSASQSISGQSVVDEIVAEQFALGEFHRYHQYRFNDCQACPDGDCQNCPGREGASAPPIQESINSKTFSITFGQTDGVDGIMNEADEVETQVTY